MSDKLNIAPFATHFFSEAFNISSGQLMGRQAAGNSYLKALFKENFDQIALYIGTIHDDPRDKANYSAIVNFLNSSVPNYSDPKVSLIPYTAPNETDQFGGIFRPDPNIVPLANHRSYYGHNEYSLVGITHTTASHEIMTCIKDMVTAPIMPWDALICTSESVKKTVETIHEEYFEYLTDKIGASKKPEIFLPIIPLGINTDEFDNDLNKNEIRESFGISKDDIAVLYVGRLSFHAKAHHIPMFLALEQVAKELKSDKLHFIMAGWFPNNEVEEMYISDARLYCPTVNVIFLDGRNQDNKMKAYTAGDIFFSLTDNIQETFGLTPLEGMASGMPVVVSDWNGYRDTVRDGIDGFRIDSTFFPEDFSNILSFRYDMDLDTYDRYCGYHSHFTSLDIQEAIKKLKLLIFDKELRHKLGSNAKKHAFDKFSWSSVLKSYSQLKDDLIKIRTRESNNYKNINNKLNSDRLPPFKIFNSYPSRFINEKVKVKKLDNINSVTYDELLEQSESIWYAKIILPEVSDINNVLKNTDLNKYVTISYLKKKTSLNEDIIIRIVALLSKYGYITLKE